MKTNTLASPKGFTLVELLTVVALMATLSTIASVVIIRQLEKGKIVEAQVMARDIAVVSELWLDDEYCFPYIKAQHGGAPEDDEAYVTDEHNNKTAKILAVLMGHDNSINKGQKNYLADFKMAGVDGKGGLALASANGTANSGGNNTGNNAIVKALTDPWGNPYILLFDHSGDEQVEAGNDAFLGDYANETWSTANLVILSGGPDGLFNKEDDIVCIR